ncbi:hypothetical protein T484DRAFT_1897509, partial [Baffinella frigidus]
MRPSERTSFVGGMPLRPAGAAPDPRLQEVIQRLEAFQHRVLKAVNAASGKEGGLSESLRLGLTRMDSRTLSEEWRAELLPTVTLALDSLLA